VKAETKSASESDEEEEHVTPKNKKGDKASTRKTIVKAKAKTEPKSASESEEEEEFEPTKVKPKKALPRKTAIKAKEEAASKGASEGEEEVKTKKRKDEEATPRKKKPTVWTTAEEEAIGKVYLEAILAVQPGHMKASLEKIWEDQDVPCKSAKDLSNHLAKWKKAFKDTRDTLTSS
jgi:hypothetical protein